MSVFQGNPTSPEDEGVDFREEKLGELEDAEKRLSEIRNEIKALEEERNQLRGDTDPDLPPIENDNFSRICQIESEIGELLGEEGAIQDDVRRLGDELSRMSRIDKYRILRNIRNLMKAKDIKVGQVEKDAGCSTGYISRLERKDNTTPPTLEFITAVSEMLGVDMDLIVKGHIDEISKTDMYMLEFISEIVSQTDRGDIIWSSIAPSNLEQPFFRRRGGYESMFYSNASITDNSGILCTIIPGSANALYLIPAKAIIDGEERRFAEVYILNAKNEKVPLYNTYDSKALLEETRILYDSAENASKKIHISEEAKSIIDSFMAKREG